MGARGGGVAPASGCNAGGQAPCAQTHEQLTQLLDPQDEARDRTDREHLTETERHRVEHSGLLNWLTNTAYPGRRWASGSAFGPKRSSLWRASSSESPACTCDSRAATVASTLHACHRRASGSQASVTSELRVEPFGCRWRRIHSTRGIMAAVARERGGRLDAFGLRRRK